MTPSYAKCLRKDVRAAAGADEGALEADMNFCYGCSQRGDQEHGVHTDDTQAHQREYISAWNSLAHLKRSQFRLPRIVLYSTAA